MRGRPPKTTTPSDKGGKSDPDPYAARLAALEGRLQLAEEQLALIRRSRLGLELRAMAASDEARRIELRQEREAEQRRADAAPSRAAKLADFGRERFAFCDGLAVSVSGLLDEFDKWARSRGVPKLLRCETEAELVEAMSAAFPEYPSLLIESPGSLQQPAPLEPGYIGLGLVAEGEDPADFVERLQEAERAELVEAARRRDDIRFDAELRDGAIERQYLRDEAARLTVENARKRGV